jgi:hypothetical protein
MTVRVNKAKKKVAPKVVKEKPRPITAVAGSAGGFVTTANQGMAGNT